MNLIVRLLGIPVISTINTLLSASHIKIEGASMSPSYQKGQHYLIDRNIYRATSPERGDVVVFRHPSAQETILLKRIVGLPGEQIRFSLCGSKILINCPSPENDSYQTKAFIDETAGLELRLADDEFFVLGDNVNFSLDSRRLGPIKRSWILGKAWIRVWKLRSRRHA